MLDKVLITSGCHIDSDGYYLGVATTEDGIIMAEHVSSCLEWSKIDMTNPYKISKYNEYLPNGFEIIFNGESIGKATRKETAGE